MAGSALRRGPWLAARRRENPDAGGLAWLLGGVLVGLGFGLAAVVQPLIALGVPAGVAAVVGAWRLPKLAVAATVVGVLFAPMITDLVPAYQSFDEAATILLGITALGRALAGVTPVRRVPALPWFALFLVAGLASAWRGDVPPGIVAQDLLLLFKGLVLYVVVVQLEWTSADLDRAIRVGASVAVVVGVLILLNLALGPLWYALFSQNGKLIQRAGIPSPIGPFGHPGAAGQAMAMFGSAALAYTTLLARDPRARWIWVATLVIALLTLRRKAIFGFLLASGVITAQSQIARRLGVVLALAIVPLGALLAWDSLSAAASYTYDDYFGARTSEAARTVLYSTPPTSRSSSSRSAPGSAATAPSRRSQLQPALLRLRLPGRVGPGSRHRALRDRHLLARVLGEGGVLGLLGYAGGMLAIAVILIRRLRLAARLHGIVDPRIRFVIAVAIAWWVEFLVESVAAPVYASPPLYAALRGARHRDGASRRWWREYGPADHRHAPRTRGAPDDGGGARVSRVARLRAATRSHSALALAGTLLGERPAWRCRS